MSKRITRRELLRVAVAAPLISSLPGSTFTQKPARLQVETARSAVIATDQSTDISSLNVLRNWKGPLCQSRLINRGPNKLKIKEVVLFDLPLDLPATTRLYGEGFQMLTQTGGTLGEPADLGNYTDAKHYKIPAPEGSRALYGMMLLSPPDAPSHMLAFTSCRRFIGKFYLKSGGVQVVVDTENRELAPGESWELEEFTYQTGDREQLLDALARRLTRNHPTLPFAKPPTGWCSWYCFGPRVTAQQVLDNLDFIARNVPGLKYIQIDDGYQPAMGDWLETGAAFGGNVQGVLKEIKKRGFEPAIWIAPFIAEEKSHVFQQHPEWFVMDENGKPLRSDTVTFGGWRRGPWYVLDGTHPEVQKHFIDVLTTMRREWGVTYFKLDANFWGAIHGGRFHDKRATRIEAYRRGMQAILNGAGNGFVLGCNHPIWPSLGLIHGSRSSNDIKRSWDRFETTARQNLSRNWQNGRLWWNDPDAIVLTGDLSEEEFRFHATSVYATGGMLLSGDDLTKISSDRLEMLRKLQPPTATAARFDDDSLRVGRVNLGEHEIVCVFNFQEAPQTLSFKLNRKSTVTDFWSGQSLGVHSGVFEVNDMPKRFARILICA